jgi:thiosulfate dehydrogenase [quinone] large subunit
MWSAATRRRVAVDPPIARFLFEDTRFSWFWLLARLYVGYDWLFAGINKLRTPAWWDSGEALKGFWTNAVAIAPSGQAPATFDWYRAFISFMLDTGQYVWFAKFLTVSEIAVGSALLLGAFTGIAAFAGGFMNWNFMMAGTASINPLLFTISILLILAWKTAGYIGLDYFLLPLLGTPWQPGSVFVGPEEEAERPPQDRGRRAA